jgi:hypothetical protein
MASALLTIADRSHAASPELKQAASYVRCAPGKDIADPQPGDLILIRGRGPVGGLIRAVQCVRIEEGRTARSRIGVTPH